MAPALATNSLRLPVAEVLTGIPQLDNHAPIPLRWALPAPQSEGAGPSWDRAWDARTIATLMERHDRAGYSIFIAHAPADTGVAEELTLLLAETGATVRSGADTSLTPEAQEELEQAALAADAYVALLSPASIASPRMRALTRKYYDTRQADPRHILLPVWLAPLTPSQLWPFLLDYERIEAAPRTINEMGERMAIAPEILALGVLQGLHLPIPARLRRFRGVPVEPPERVRRPSGPISAPLTGGLVPQLSPPVRCPRRPSRTLMLSAVAAALVVAFVATLAFFGGAIPFHLDGSASPRPTATIRTLILTTSTPEATAVIAPTATGAATGTAAPQPTATPAPSSTATLTATPTATPSPPPPLTLSALHLSHVQGNQCAGSQTIANTGGQQMTWQWDSTQPSLPFSFVYGVNTTAQFGGFPADLFPGLAAGGTDMLNVQMRCSGQSYTVTLRDGLGRTQQFTMISD
jgi:TIR domain